MSEQKFDSGQPLAPIRKTARMRAVEAAHAGQDVRLLLIQLYNQHGNQRAVAHALGVSQASVANWLGVLGVRTQARSVAWLDAARPGAEGAAMNAAVVVMHALKETCALHCLVALHLAGPRPATQQTVMAITGFDDGAVHRGLHKLLALGLVTCSGQRHHTGWRLAPAAAQLPLGLAIPPDAESAPAIPGLAESGIERDREREKKIDKDNYLFNSLSHNLNPIPRGAESADETRGDKPAGGESSGAESSADVQRAASPPGERGDRPASDGLSAVVESASPPGERGDKPADYDESSAVVQRASSLPRERRDKPADYGSSAVIQGAASSLEARGDKPADYGLSGDVQGASSPGERGDRPAGNGSSANVQGAASSSGERRDKPADYGSSPDVQGASPSPGERGDKPADYGSSPDVQGAASSSEKRRDKPADYGLSAVVQGAASSPVVRRASSRPAAAPRAATATPLETALLQIFHHAHIWPGGRARLARELAAEGEHWLPQSLGWLCYAVRCFPRMNLGAVVYPALRDRLACAPEFLPPPELPFEAALAWAARGGEAAVEYANERGAADRQTPEETSEAGSQTSAGEAAAPARLPPSASDRPPPAPDPWSALLTRLRADRGGADPPPLLAGARLEPAGPGAWRLWLPTPQARAWVSLRMQPRLERLLAEVTGGPVALEIGSGGVSPPP